MLNVVKLQLSLIGAVMALSACSDKSADISILSDSDSFVQTRSVNNKIDILWMVDSSGSMQPYQNNLADNFSTFINDFVTKGYDYNMAVGATDAWHRERTTYNPNTNWDDCAKESEITAFRMGDIYDNGPGCATLSGIPLITSGMIPADIISTFSQNIKVGIRSDGDERGFQSIRGVLRRNEDGSAGYSGETHNQLANFRRSAAFLAVVVVADEEDNSRKRDGTNYSNLTDYTNSFVSFLDGYTGSTVGNRKYNVSSIVVSDINNCPGHHSAATQGDRYMSVSNATNGVIGSICDTNFSSKLAEIAGKIGELSTRFKLSREPVLSSIVVKVNSVQIPESTVNGWTYVNESGFHYIEFRGSATPAQGASIQVDFDPVSLE